jgi:PAS domain S-box-containing protein
MLSEFFLAEEHKLAMALDYSYNHWLVVLSYAVAVFAAYTAFQLLERVIAAPNRIARLNWLVTGSVSMGCGIWSMHFLAMLAVQMPHEMRYDPVLTALSAVFAMLASGFAFDYVGRGSRKTLRLVLAGAVLGAGIGAMHYTGMLAMRTHGAIIRYDPVLFGASIVVAVLLATLALRLMFYTTDAKKTAKRFQLVATAAVMGLSVTLMHYTGMAATHLLHAAEITEVQGVDLQGSLIGLVIGGSAFLMLGLTWLGANIDQRMRGKDVKLRQSQDMLQAIVDTAPDGIFTFDEQGTLKSLNPAARKIFGYSSEEVLGQHLSMLIPTLEPANQDNKAAELEPGEAGDARAPGHRREIEGLRKDGVPFPLEIAITSMQLHGQPLFVGVCTDITSQRETENQLRQSQKMDAIGQLAGGIAHDLNNVLVPVLCLTQLTMGQLPSESQACKNLENVLQASKRAKRLVAQILAYSRADQPERAPVRPSDILEEVLQLLRATMPSTIEIRPNIDHDADLVLADSTQIHQVLINLASNAGHAMEQNGGILDVILEPVDVDEELAAKVADLEPGLYSRVTVSDTGTGMDAKTIERIFDPFFTTKAVGEGTGMGLSVVHGIIAKHEGAIAVSSAPGQGTTFELYLPQVSKEALAEAS